MDPIALEVCRHRLAALCEEMGATLGRCAYSPNIKERRDYSCALFDTHGSLAAQAAHIPVHLGAMPLSVAAALERLTLAPGDVALLNDPFAGGSHLPDLTVVAPVHDGGTLLGYLANRAHHADVGGGRAGSMGAASDIFGEGLRLPPVKLTPEVEAVLLANSRTPDERRGDLAAQRAALHVGAQRLVELGRTLGPAPLAEALAAVQDYSERVLRGVLSASPDGCWEFADALDDGTRLHARVTLAGDRATIDLRGCDGPHPGCLNAPRAVTLSAVVYCFACLLPRGTPVNGGCFRPLELLTTPGSLVDAQPPVAVAGGNVETSQRLVDVVFGALAQALPERIPAASQGTMNNLLMGGRGWTYYETLAGGHGARRGGDGPSGQHSHMTNTLNTPVEALEYAFPLRVERYELRAGSGGAGRWRGGEGLVRELTALADCEVTLLSERRSRAPWGLAGGGDGACGENAVDGQLVPGHAAFNLTAGQTLSVGTPGGGGWGPPDPSAPGRDRDR